MTGRLLQRLQHLSIRFKLTTIGLLTSLTVLVIAGICFLVLDQITFRHRLGERAQTLARIVGANSRAALAFGDADVAVQILQALAAEEDIHAARLCDAALEPLATYRGLPVPDSVWTSPVWARTPVAQDGYLYVKETLSMDGEVIGAVRLLYSLSPLRIRFWWGLGLALVVIAGTVGAGAILSWGLQRQVSAPILALTNTVGQVTRSEDVSARVGTGGQDEIGELMRGFNSMLEKIQLREAEVRNYQEQLRQMADNLMLSEERERRRIADGIHDSICQQLGGALLHAQHLQGKVERDVVKTGLQELIQIMRDALAVGRDLSFELGPPSLYELGLGPALTALAGEMKRHYALDVAVIGENTETVLSSDESVVLYRAARELLVNVHKYAGVQDARVELSTCDGVVCLVVSDQGCGFSPETLDPVGSGFGLFSIREHLRTLGGSVTISASPGEGTMITLHLPTT
ncbi:MAG: HAMP domain-containing protein [Verrucomicrobia bacterium]|jgi:signal transduction histidine kinase|nr:HAMP domain-containing protein [Verrucomicrobiota bacterium]MBT7065693.1 HAMP domain-containing protein [Verrucomicrobiota bacterium]MBT7699104.1 HAMP domain-containing protein [Verrucomicrobiota bacterium]